MALRVRNLILTTIAVAGFAGVPTAVAAASAPSSTANASGGVSMVAPPGGVSTKAHPMVQGSKARIIHGVAYAPSYAPIQVKKAIWAGNQIRKKPYI